MPEEKFSVDVPVGWVEISRDELDQLERDVRERSTSTAPTQRYLRGYRASSSSEFPKVLIQLKDRRISEEALESMKATGVAADKAQVEKDIASKSPDLAKLQLKLGELRYDERRFVIWIRAQMKTPNGQNVDMLSALHPTNSGSIQLHCYDTSAKFEDTELLCESIATSVKLDESIRYRKQGFADRVFQPGAMLRDALTGIAIVLLLAAGRWWWRRRSPPPPKLGTSGN